jgi:hypothetical protein
MTMNYVNIKQAIWMVIFPALVAWMPNLGACAAEPLLEVRWSGGVMGSLKARSNGGVTDFIQSGRLLGTVVLRYREPGGSWQSVNSAALSNAATVTVSADSLVSDAAFSITNGPAAALNLGIRFAVQGRTILWTLYLQNVSKQPLEIGDLALPLPMSGGGKGQPVILKHSFISGHGSFLFWMRSDSAKPFLTMVPAGDTSLEYWDSSREGGYRVFIHSAVAGAEAKERGTNWRQPHTSLKLAPKGQPGDSRSYVFKLGLADDYDGVRQTLVDEGGLDVQVVPGMTVPTDLSARFALRTKQKVDAVEAEFQGQTRIESMGAKGDFQLYQVRFTKLGENRLTVRYGHGRHMFLEFFSTEPLETLIKKRAAFLAKSQHRDPSKWYNGLITDWNMESQLLLGPDNYDRIKGWRIYEVSCDDPGLGKPAYLAAKNAEFPNQGEVEALDYYIQHFVWGGLQQTTGEPYPYGIYGIPDWKQNRDSPDPGRGGRRHLWRVYDYPHIIQMYFAMYRVAKHHPQITTVLSVKDYLLRAYGTARAMFTVPMEIERWSAYDTGFYNELAIVDLIGALETEGMKTEADTLRGFWDHKVKNFVNHEQDLFRSEYAFDSTGFESTHALAKYAMLHADQPGETNSGIPVANAQRFLEKQMAANLFCRGWVEPAYYYLGSDYRGGGGNAYTLTYMSQMGGWSVLDYALNFATNPAPYLRLGYASYLSAWALMNTGTPESGYGYWYPGQANDGGAGGGFEPAPFGKTWLEQPHHRGSWYYACEIDLGYCGALRTAATVLADDPIFGRICLGGDWRKTEAGLEVTPKDGLRRRFYAALGGGKLQLVSDSDRFPATQPIILKEDLSEVRFFLESDNPAAHPARLRLTGLTPGEYTVSVGEVAVAPVQAGKGRETVVVVPISAGLRPQSVAIARRR